MNYPRVYSHFQQYLFISLITAFLYGLSLIHPYLCYGVLAELGMISIFKMDDAITVIEFTCIFAKVFLSNIWLDLIFNLLTLYKITIRGGTTTSRIYVCIIMSLSVVPFYASDVIASLILSTLAACNFTVVNIFKETLFNKRLMIEYNLTLFFFALLYINIIPIYILQNNIYLVSALIVSFLVIKKKYLRPEDILSSVHVV